MTLINYGIQDEQSDWRAHVSVCNATVYLFPTCAGLQELKSGKYNLRAAYTGNARTASGIAVPIKSIFGMTVVPIPPDIFWRVNFKFSDNTSDKGAKATRAVLGMMKAGKLPYFGIGIEVTDKDLQINGTDILDGNCRIQVKCDWRAGETGNVYLQTQERNLFQRR